MQFYDGVRVSTHSIRSSRSMRDAECAMPLRADDGFGRLCRRRDREGEQDGTA